MVAASGADADARLFPGGRRRRPPFLALSRRPLRRNARTQMVRPWSVRVTYAELAITTNFSFLRGASSPKELAISATLQGHYAIGIADRNTLAGVVRAYDALSHPKLPKNKPKLLVGSRLVFRDGTPDILAYPTNRAAYGRLCRLLSAGKLRAP